MPNVLFYSTRCKKCLFVVSELKKNGLLKTFTKKVNVDKVQRSQLPGFLKTVPTILSDDYKKPLEYSDIINWIEYKNKQNSMGSGHQQQSQEIEAFCMDGSFGQSGLIGAGNEDLKTMASMTGVPGSNMFAALDGGDVKPPSDHRQQMSMAEYEKQRG